MMSDAHHAGDFREDGLQAVDIERLGARLENWVQSAPGIYDVSTEVYVAQVVLLHAGMVQYNADGWDFKLHEQHPDAPRSRLKLMIREAAGTDTNPDYYDDFTLPAVLQASRSGLLADDPYVVGYPNAGTPIAEAFVRMAKRELGVDLTQLQQAKITHQDGRRELGPITSDYQPGEKTLAIDDTATGGGTKIEGWHKITEHDLAYAGLVLIVERDPLSTAWVSERTGAPVQTSIHWLTLIRHAVELQYLPADVIQHELDYSRRLFDWNAAHSTSDNLPRLTA